MASGDTGGQIRFLELIGRGFEEVNRHTEALRFVERAIKLADAEKDSGLPFMAYEGKARALVALGRPSEAKAVLENALSKARSQQKRGHEAELLILLEKLASQTGDMKQAIADLESAAQFSKRVQFFRMRPMPCSSWRRFTAMPATSPQRSPDAGSDLSMISAR
jgi:tetratricopeptide (TPR) repeat protein